MTRIEMGSSGSDSGFTFWVSPSLKMTSNYSARVVFIEERRKRIEDILKEVGGGRIQTGASRPAGFSRVSSLSFSLLFL